MDNILNFCYEHCRNLRADYTSKNNTDRVLYFDVTVGKKYYKIVQVTDAQKFVHCFVDRNTGDVYKAATFAQPAKGVRYNILRDMDILRNADWAGGYLYKR